MSKIMLKDVRIAFIGALWDAEEYKGDGNFKYRATFILTPKQAKEVNTVMEAVATAEFKAKAKAVLESIKGSTKDCCFTSGDLKEYDGFAGNMILSAIRKAQDGPPAVIDRVKNAVTQKSGLIYAGCYVNAHVELWAQNNSHGKAIRCTLIGVQFNREGDAFSSTAKASTDDFDELEDIGENDLG